MKYLTLAVLAIIPAMAGCSSIGMDKYLGNRVACTVAGDKAYVTSLWGPVGISSEIVPKDSKIICASKAGRD